MYINLIKNFRAAEDIFSLQGRTGRARLHGVFLDTEGSPRMNSIHIDLLGTETKYYQTANYRTRVIEAGAGTPLFMFHGGGGHAETYARNMQRLAAVCRPIAPDFIWHGL